MIKESSKEQIQIDGLQIFNLLNDIYLRNNPYDDHDSYIKECRRQFAGIERVKNIESIKDDIFNRWKNKQIDSLKNQGEEPDKDKVISYLQNGLFVITDYQYLFYKMQFT